jgi:bacterioferritin (cytochrome b1)
MQGQKKFLDQLHETLSGALGSIKDYTFSSIYK